MSRRLMIVVLVVSLFLAVSFPIRAIQSESAASRLIDQVMTNGQQMKILSMLSDEIGHRLTGSPGARRAEEVMEAEMKRLGLANVRREPFTVPASWERGSAVATLVSHGNRALVVASYTWTPGTNGVVEGRVVDLGPGRQQQIEQARAQLRGAMALVTLPSGSLDELIASFYGTPDLARSVKEAGAAALFITSDKQHTMTYTAPIEFNGRMAALPSLSIAREDASLIQRLIGRGQTVRVRLDVRNKLGPAFESTNVIGEIRGREKPDEIVVVGAHLDSNDLGPGAQDNAAGVAGVMEMARALKSLGLVPRRTIRFVLFMGEEEGMLGSTAYVRRHRDEMDRMVAALIMDIGAGKPLGWFSMGRDDLDPQIREVMVSVQQFGVSVIEHAAFAATDNAAFMAEGVPNLVLIQDGDVYFPIHHTIADTPDKADPRDYAKSVATLAVTAYAIADRAERFGRRLTAEEVKTMATATKVDAQWRAAGIWP